MIASVHKRAVAAVAGVTLTGRVREIGADHLVSDGPLASVGSVCTVDLPGGGNISAEIVSVDTDRITLIPYSGLQSVRPGARVALARERTGKPVGDGLGGRLIDALGQPIDDKGPIKDVELQLDPTPIPQPLARATSPGRLPTGLKAIDALMPIVRGQRIGIFAASGVGKTTLVTQLARQVSCDRVVLCLVGERGREVERMWTEVGEGQSPLAEISVVAATSDCSPTLRIRVVEQALAMAEHWRDAGDDVLIVFDSITRYAMALREVGLAAGAPPTLRAYTPNVFSALPKVVERCGALKSGGSITGMFNVLSETDDMDDPIVEAMKSYLDGHIVLSRDLAETGHYPAIDVLGSISRLASDVMTDNETSAARQALKSLSTYKRAQILVESGIYKAGSDADIDAAIRNKPALDQFLQQATEDNVRPENAFTALRAALAGGVS